MRRALVLLLVLALCAAGCEDKTTPTTARQLAFATSDDSGFSKMGEPQAGDWLARFKEFGQTFDQYVASGPVRAAGVRRVLAFLPVGPFSMRERALLDRTVSFARLWFGLEVSVLGDKPLPARGWKRTHHGRTQYRTAYFLDNLLPDNLPKDAVCLFGVTMADLYPDENWNFVFGVASLRRRVGVWSFARYYVGFRGLEETDATRLTALRRACKVVVHEAGHAFGLKHCIDYACNMNGSNSLAETDRQPLRLGPVCLRKLQFNRGFDVMERYRRLAGFYSENGLEQEAAWTRRRLAKIGAVK